MKIIEFKSKSNAIFIAIIIMSFIFSIAEAQDVNIQNQEPINDDQKEEVEKDNWDKISAVSDLITGGLIALIIALLTNYYKDKERLRLDYLKNKELSIMRTNVVLGFFEYLERKDSGMAEAEDSGMTEAALKAILSLDLDFGIELCKTFPDPGANILNDLKIMSEKAHDDEKCKKANDALKIIQVPDGKVENMKGRYGDGEIIGQIAQKIDEPRGSVRLKVNQMIKEGELKLRKIDDPEITKNIINLYNSGMGKSEIAREMHLPLREVRLKIEQLVKEGRLEAR